MRAAILLALALASGCTMQNFNRGWLVASHVSVACDYGQTLEVARRGWPERGPSEGNPILGSSPSPTRLTVYNGAALGGITGAYLASPERFRWMVPLLVTIMQLQVITMNTIAAPKPWCGIR